MKRIGRTLADKIHCSRWITDASDKARRTPHHLNTLVNGHVAQRTIGVWPRLVDSRHPVQLKILDRKAASVKSDATATVRARGDAWRLVQYIRCCCKNKN